MRNNWWEINPETIIDTPFLAVHTDRMLFNIQKLLDSVHGDTQKLRPHIKTHKTGEILALFKTYKIDKVKCATIAEAELSAMYNISDILLAYQPAGLKKNRWTKLIQKYPNVVFSTIVDNLKTIEDLTQLAKKNNLILNVFVDIDTGMNRTGIAIAEKWEDLATKIIDAPTLHFSGIHIYDGHIKGPLEQRIQDAATYLNHIQKRLPIIQETLDYKIKIVAGGSNTFPYYSTIDGIECSPGTFIFWDVNYQTHLPEQDFKTAAVIVGTVISKPTSDTLCIDIGYKSVASENPLEKRLRILNDENLIPIAHSEEHLVLQNTGEKKYAIGDNIYALPYHVCPTCALYESLQVINIHGNIIDQWNVLARNKKISI